jgi:hypothetical protein
MNHWSTHPGWEKITPLGSSIVPAIFRLEKKVSHNREKTVWQGDKFIFTWESNWHLAGEYKLKMIESAELSALH